MNELTNKVNEIGILNERIKCCLRALTLEERTPLIDIAEEYTETINTMLNELEQDIVKFCE